MIAEKKLGIAVIGCGAISHNAHLPGIKASNFELVAVCDMQAERAQALADAAGNKPSVYTDHKSLLERDDIHVVSVATPPFAHAPLTIDALNAGKHVLCEKPSALTIAENIAMRDAAAANKKTCQFFSSRFRHGANHHAKAIIDSGRLGKIYHVDVQMWLPRSRACDKPDGALWFGNKDLAGGGAFMDMGQYFLDQVFHLIDWPAVQRVNAQGYYGFDTGLGADVRWDVEDHMCAHIALANGINISMDTCARVNQHWRWGVTIKGTKGCLSLDKARHNVPLLLRYENAHGEKLEERLLTTDNPNDMAVRLGGLEDILNDKPYAYGTTPEQALHISELCTMAYQSEQLGRAVTKEDLV